MASKGISAEPIVDIFDDDDEGWQDMPVVREDDGFGGGLDEEDQKKYKYVPTARKQAAAGASSNATGNLLDIDDFGHEWRDKLDQNESEYTRLRINEEDDADEVHLRTKYLFDEDKAMTPLSQMQATKGLLTEAQRIAYVGLCELTSREMAQTLRDAGNKQLKPAIQGIELWALKIMGRLYYHMEVATEEQKMIESLAVHGVQAMDLVPALMTTHTVANPEYDPTEARRQADTRLQDAEESSEDIGASASQVSPSSGKPPPTPTTATAKNFQTTTRVLEASAEVSLPGVSTSLSSADENVTLDIRWTILCDLFLILIADSVYDARSRVLLESVALKLGLGWLEVAKFESRVTEALEIQEGVEQMEQKEVVESRQKSSKKRRYMMMGLATLGGGLVIGLSAGLLAPVIGVGLGAALSTVGITGTGTFLAGAGGAAVITTGGVLTGSGIAARGMARRTRLVRTFDVLPLHNNKRVSCILTVPGFLNGLLDDPRLPYSVLDPVVGDVFSVLWEPEMIRETGDALKILTGEVLSQLAQTALQATVMTALMSALQWPIILTKLGYLIDNPWSNALDRAKAAGGVLADVLIQRHLGVRPITLIGFSLGSRVIFYALLELARQKAFGIVQDVIILGTTVTASTSTWHQARSAVAGRFVNGYARNDWVLNYLFRATSGGLNTVAGLRPIEGIPGLENVDVTDKIAGHMSYRTFMPLILDSLGFPVSADYFDEPVEPDFEGERVVIREEDLPKKKGWFGRKSKQPSVPPTNASRPPVASQFSSPSKKDKPQADVDADDELPPREDKSSVFSTDSRAVTPPPPYKDSGDLGDSPSGTSTPPNLPPSHAGFDFSAIKATLGKEGIKTEQPASKALPSATSDKQRSPLPTHVIASPTEVIRPDSAPPASQSNLAQASAGKDKGRASFGSPGAAGLEPEPDMNAKSDLAWTASRSLSLNNGAQHAEGEGEGTTSRATSRPPPAPSLSFGSADGAVWTPPADDPFADGRTPTPFGSSGGPGYAPSGTSYALPGPVLSFGGAGAASFGAPEPDPWSLPQERKAAGGYGSNPWG